MHAEVAINVIHAADNWASAEPKSYFMRLYGYNREKNRWIPLKFLLVLEPWRYLPTNRNPDNQDSHLFILHKEQTWSVSHKNSSQFSPGSSLVRTSTINLTFLVIKILLRILTKSSKHEMLTFIMRNYSLAVKLLAGVYTIGSRMCKILERVWIPKVL